MMMQCEMCYLGNERHPTMKTSKKYIVCLYSVPCYDPVMKQQLRPFIKAVRTNDYDDKEDDDNDNVNDNDRSK